MKATVFLVSFTFSLLSPKLVTLGQRSRSQLHYTHFFLPNSLLTSLLCISAHLCSIKMKFVMLLGRIVLKFRKNRIGDGVIVTSIKFSPNNCPYLKFKLTNFILGTKTQQHNVHLMINIKMTLTDDECHRQRSKVAKNELMVIYRTLLH